MDIFELACQALEKLGLDYEADRGAGRIAVTFTAIAKTGVADAAWLSPRKPTALELDLMRLADDGCPHHG